MITDPRRLGFYTQTNLALIAAYQRDLANLAEDWSDRATGFALSGNPQRAGYYEHFIGRIA